MGSIFLIKKGMIDNFKIGLKIKRWKQRVQLRVKAGHKVILGKGKKTKTQIPKIEKKNKKNQIIQTKGFSDKNVLKDKLWLKYQSLPFHYFGNDSTTTYVVDAQEIYFLGFQLATNKRNRYCFIEYFYGRAITESKHSVVNFSFLLWNFRASLNFIKDSLFYNAKLMLVGLYHKFTPPTIFRFHFVFKGPWIPGFLGNFRTLRFQHTFWYKQKSFPTQFVKKQKSVTSILLADVGMVTFPNILFATTTTDLLASVIPEALTLHMPSSAVITPSLSLDFRLATYPIMEHHQQEANNYFF